MSLSYTVENLQKMRETAGLGTLSMGVCALSGELVSSTPIPGSRCGRYGQNTADYGGYLLGEGMTREAAIYLANLHNWFPLLAEAIPETADPRGDTAYLGFIRNIAERYGWFDSEDSLSEWIDQRLKAQENQDACLLATLEENARLKGEVARAQENHREVIGRLFEAEAERDAVLTQVRMLKEELQRRAHQIGVACLKHDLTHSLGCGRCLQDAEQRLAAIDAAKDAEPMPATLGDTGIRLETPLSFVGRLQTWGRQGWDAAAALRVEVARIRGIITTCDNSMAQARKKGRIEERERIVNALAIDLNFPFVVCCFDRRAHAGEEIGREMIGSANLRIALEPQQEGQVNA